MPPLETPAVGAAAISPFGGDTPNTPPPAPPSGPKRSRPSDFQPGYGAPEPEPAQDPSRIVKRLEVSAAGNPDDVDGLNIDDAEQDPAAEQDVDPETEKRNALTEKFREQLESGVLKASDFNDVPFEFELPNGQTVKLTPKQLIAGNMRQSEFTRQLHTAQRAQSEASNLIHLEKQRRVEWRNPHALMNGLTQMGLQEAFVAAVDQHVQQEVQFRRLPPERQQAIRAQQQVEHMQQMYEQERQQLLQQLQQRDQPNEMAVTQHFQNQLAQMMPAPFKKYALPTNHPYVRQEFLNALQTLYDGRELTADMVDQAAEATAELWHDKREEASARRNAQVRAAARGGALPARRSPGGPGTSLSTNGKRSRPSDFQTKFNSYGV